MYVDDAPGITPLRAQLTFPSWNGRDVLRGLSTFNSASYPGTFRWRSLGELRGVPEPGLRAPRVEHGLLRAHRDDAGAAAAGAARARRRPGVADAALAIVRLE
jgi:hypothetical protein